MLIDENLDSDLRDAAVKLGKQHRMCSMTWPDYVVPHIAKLMVRQGDQLVNATPDDMADPKKALWFVVRLSYPTYYLGDVNDYDFVAVRDDKFYRISRPYRRSRLRFGKRIEEAVRKGIRAYLKFNGYGT